MRQEDHLAKPLRHLKAFQELISQQLARWRHGAATYGARIRSTLSLLGPDYIAPFPFRPSSAPSRGASRGSSPARLRLGPRSPEPSRPCSAPGRLSPWRRGARAASPKRSAWSADGQRHDRRMPKLNRKQRAVGAKEKSGGPEPEAQRLERPLRCFGMRLP